MKWKNYTVSLVEHELEEWSSTLFPMQLAHINGTSISLWGVVVLTMKTRFLVDVP